MSGKGSFRPLVYDGHGSRDRDDPATPFDVRGSPLSISTKTTTSTMVMIIAAAGTRLVAPCNIATGAFSAAVA